MDDLSASFRFSADFLLAWQPYYYDIRLSVEIQAKYCTTLKDVSASISADLHLWGPEFSGEVYIDLDMISFEIKFGQAEQQPPQAIAWQAFKTAFLPIDRDICRVIAGQGLIKTLSEGSTKRWVMNPRDFTLTAETAVPIKQAFFGESRQLLPSNTVTLQTQFGISSMDIQAENLKSDYHITIKRNDQACEQNDFTFEPIIKNVPLALWGESLAPDLNGQLISNVLTSFQIKPGQPPQPGQTNEIDCSNLEIKLEHYAQPYQWEQSGDIQQQQEHPEQFIQTLAQLFKVSSEAVNICEHSPILAELLAHPIAV